jgi:DNA repair protein RadC
MADVITDKNRISDMIDTEKPREKLASLGHQSLSNAELLAILIRTGLQGENAVQVGQRLLKKFNGLTGIHRASFIELQKEKGIGLAKAAQIKAAIELGRRMTLESPEERPAIHSPADAAALVQYEMSALDQEHLWVLLLDIRNRVMATIRLYKGALSSSQVRVGEVFRDAVKQNAAGIVVVHNHPSGDSSPSPDDVAVTRALVSAGKLLDIEVVDHLVIGQGSYVSMKQRGLGF